MTIQKLLDSSGNVFYPVCHTDAIKVSNEVINLTEYLSDIILGIQDFALILGYEMRLSNNPVTNKVEFSFSKINLNG